MWGKLTSLWWLGNAQAVLPPPPLSLSLSIFLSISLSLSFSLSQIMMGCTIFLFVFACQIIATVKSKAVLSWFAKLITVVMLQVHCQWHCQAQVQEHTISHSSSLIQWITCSSQSSCSPVWLQATLRSLLKTLTGACTLLGWIHCCQMDRFARSESNAIPLCLKVGYWISLISPWILCDLLLDSFFVYLMQLLESWHCLAYSFCLAQHMFWCVGTMFQVANIFKPGLRKTVWVSEKPKRVHTMYIILKPVKNTKGHFCSSYQLNVCAMLFKDALGGRPSDHFVPFFLCVAPDGQNILNLSLWNQQAIIPCHTLLVFQRCTAHTNHCWNIIEATVLQLISSQSCTQDAYQNLRPLGQWREWSKDFVKTALFSLKIVFLCVCRNCNILRSIVGSAEDQFRSGWSFWCHFSDCRPPPIDCWADTSIR